MLSKWFLQNLQIDISKESGHTLTLHIMCDIVNKITKNCSEFYCYITWFLKCGFRELKQMLKPIMQALRLCLMPKLSKSPKLNQTGGSYQAIKLALFRAENTPDNDQVK